MSVQRLTCILINQPCHKKWTFWQMQTANIDKGLCFLSIYMWFIVSNYSVFSYFISPLNICCASVAQLDARPTGDQVVGSTPAEVSKILSWRVIMKYFLRSFSPFPIQEGQLSVSKERMCTILVNRLED